MKYYIIVLLAVIGLAINFALVKLYQTRTGSGIRISVLYNVLSGICTAIFFLCVNSFHITFTPFSLLMAILWVLFCGTYIVLGFILISKGNIATYTLFLMLGGMMIPYFFGLCFLNEEFTVWRLIGLLLMVVSVILSGIKEKSADTAAEKSKHSRLYLLLCLAVFILNGCVSVTSKLHQLPEYKSIAVSETEFIFWTAIVKIVLFSLVYLVLILRERHSGKRDESAKTNASVKALFTPAVLAIVVACALVEALSLLGQLYSASHLPATVLYPLVTGGVVVLTALAGRLFFKEKLSRRALFGVILCFVSTFFFL